MDLLKGLRYNKDAQKAEADHQPEASQLDAPVDSRYPAMVTMPVGQKQVISAKDNVQGNDTIKIIGAIGQISMPQKVTSNVEEPVLLDRPGELATEPVNQKNTKITILPRSTINKENQTDINKMEPSTSILENSSKNSKKSSGNLMDWFLHGNVGGSKSLKNPENKADGPESAQAIATIEKSEISATSPVPPVNGPQDSGKNANEAIESPVITSSGQALEDSSKLPVEKANTNSPRNPVPVSKPKSKSSGNLIDWFLHGNVGGKGTQKAETSIAGANTSSASLPSEQEVKETMKSSGLKTKVAEALKPLNIGLSKPKINVEFIDFNVGELSYPNLDKPIKETNVTYPVDAPFQYVNVRFDGEELVYNALEPPMSEGEKKYLAIIERSLEKLISSKIVAIRPEEREDFLRMRFSDIIRMYGFPLSEAHQDRMFYYLRKRYLGYDKIDIIMKDHYIEDISCNGPNNYMYIYHRVFGSVRTNVSFEEVELNKFVMRMAQISGRHISILQPIKDITMPDGSRANLTLGSEVTKKGATFTIRKFREKPMSPIELMEYKSIDPRVLAYLWLLLDYKKSILVSGGTASGKTTLMNVIASFIRPELKIVSLEDTAELNLSQTNWIQSVTRSGFGVESGGSAPSGVSMPGKSPGDIGLYDLLVAALRQRPEYIIIGEVRGAEAFTMFQAIAVGHACMGTIHAGSMRELLSRIEANPMNVPRTLFASLDAVCFAALIRRGDRNVRRVMSIVEILELDPNGDLITNPVFRWDAVSDRFIFAGKSHIFEKIENQLGVKEEVLMKEMEARANYLVELREKNIRDYSAVVEKIREYVLNH